MASLSPQGERATLALVADLYAQNVDLREALAAECAAHGVTRGDLDRLRASVLAEALDESRATVPGTEAHSADLSADTRGSDDDPASP